MKTFRLLSGFVMVCVCSSCISYRHSVTNLDGTVDSTRFNSFFMLGSANKIRSATKMGTNYNRTVSVGAIEGKGDAELITAIAVGVAAGLKAGAGVP